MFEPQSPVRAEIYQVIRPFIPALRLIDDEMFDYKLFTVPVLTAMIASDRVDGASALEFWRKVYQDEGSKIGKERCPVQALMDMLLSYKKQLIYSHKHHIEVSGKCISAYEGWKKGITFKRPLRATIFQGYIKNKVKHVSEAECTDLIKEDTLSSAFSRWARV